MWFSKWLSIQSNPVRVTPADWLCVSQESRQSGATRMLVPSIHYSTRATLPGIRQTRQRISTRPPNERPKLTPAWATDSAKQLPRRELFPKDLLGDVTAPEPPSFSVFLRSCVVFLRGVPEFAVRDRLLLAKGLRSALEAQEEYFAEVERELSGEPWQRSASRPISPGRPMIFRVHPVPSPARPSPLFVGRVVVRPWHRVFGKSKPAPKESVTTARRISSYQQ